MVFEYFLKTVQNKLIDEHEAISLLTFIAQQPIETITDVECISKLIFHLLSDLIPNDFYNKFLQMFHNLKKLNYLVISHDKTHVYKIYVRDKFIFKVLLLVSLKYKKSIFIPSTDSFFLQNVLQEAVNSICILKYQSLYLLRLIELILKKREDVLTPHLSVLILKNMSKAAFSPLTGFKNWAHNVSRIVLRSLPHDTKKYLCNLNNLPIKGIDLNDTLKHCEEKDIYRCFELINKKILKLFCNNTDSREGSFFYDAIANISSFDDFVENIWPHYSDHFQQFDEGEFYQSFLKYWIPITVKHYGAEFYKFVAKKDVDFHLKAYTLLETRKRGCYYKSEFDLDTFNFLKYSRTGTIGLKIICTYMKKQTHPDEFEIQAVRFYLNHYSHFEFPDYVLKSLKQFISQIFLVSHMTLSKSPDKDLKIYFEFLTFVYRFCLFRIDDREDCEVSAQLFKLVWDVASGSSSNLETPYKVDRENIYEIGGNLFYQKLKEIGFWKNTFLNPELIKMMENLLIKKFKHCPKLIQVIKERYLEVINIDDLLNLTKLLKDISRSVCLQSSEKIRAYTDLFMSYRKLTLKNSTDDIIQLCDIYDSKVGRFDSENMFIYVLILDALIIIISYDDVDVTFLIEKSLIFFEKIFDEGLGSKLNAKDVKILEAFINNTIECLTASKSHWSKFTDKELLLSRLSTIIQLSNMKRPVSLAANFVNYFGASLENDDRVIKIRLLDRTLNSLYENKQSGKIRRNPETRLVIHALCLADKSPTKPLLVSSLNFMLEVLANPLSSDSTLSATLHSLEVLVSDNSIHQFTLPFVADIIKLCIQLFDRTSWIVRNADLQLLKSLIERFLGVSLDDNVRPKTIEDVFILFPPLIPHFYEILTSSKLTDTAIMVLLFFSESQIKNDILIGDSLRNDLEKFKYVFVDIIKNYSNNAGALAIKAFISLCLHSQIPKVISEIVYYIQRDFVQMNKNFFSNLIKLLQGLHRKYKLSLVCRDEDVIRRGVNALVKYLKPFDCFYFNLLSLRLSTLDDLTDKIVATLNCEINYEQRIWLNNYLPFVITEVSFLHLEKLLHRILSCQIPAFLQVRILSNLTDRVGSKYFPVVGIIKILISKLTTLGDHNKFLITAYAKSILLFYEFASDLTLSDDVIMQIRRDFQTGSIYKVFVYVSALARYNCRSKDDEFFLHECVHKYIEFLADDEVSVDLAVTIIYLYNTVAVSDRFNVIKLIFYLLLNDCTSFEMCKFMSWLTQSQCSSILISLSHLLNYSKLVTYVGEKRLAIKLLLDFYCYVNGLPDELEESDTYYLIENYCPLTKQYIKTMILKSLESVHVCNKC